MSNATIFGDTEYNQSPANPEDEPRLSEWVAMYLAGSKIHRPLIIRAHIRLAASIAFGIAKRYKRVWMLQDIISEAFVQLVGAIDAAPTALKDNNITPYIAQTLRYRLRDFVAEDRTVFMPARTFRHKVAKGEISATNNSDKHVIGVVGVTRAVLNDVPDYELMGDEVEEKFDHIYAIPEAKRVEPSPEFQEALELSILTDRERRVINLRAEGYAYTDFESVMGLKKSSIGNIVKAVEERFNLNYA